MHFTLGIGRLFNGYIQFDNVLAWKIGYIKTRCTTLDGFKGSPIFILNSHCLLGDLVSH